MTFLQQTARRIFDTHGPSLYGCWATHPVLNGLVSVKVRGADQQPLQMRLTDMRGQIIVQVRQATSVERHDFVVGR